MGQKLRDFSELDEPLSATVKTSLEQGKLVSPEIIEEIVTHYLRTNTGVSTIFDGIPRTIEQLDMFDRLVDEYIVLFLDLDQKTALSRLENRRIDPTNGHSFPKDFEGDYSPYTGAKLVRRDDDQAEIIQKRIESFYANTLPLIAACRQRGKLVYQIDAAQSIESVTQMIQTIIRAHIH